MPSEDVLIERLPPEHRALLKGFIPDSGLEVEFPNGHVLKFRMNVTEEQMLPVTKAYAAVIDRALSENRRTFWTKALLIWLLPLLLIYAIGEGVAWVRRGFRSPVA